MASYPNTQYAGFDYNAFTSQVLGKIGAPDTFYNKALFLAWYNKESTTATNNPLATTLPYGGAGTFNGVGVKNYASFQDGVNATAQTLLGGNYSGIVNDLRKGNVDPVKVVSQNAEEFNTWGGSVGPDGTHATGSYAPSLASDLKSEGDQTIFQSVTGGISSGISSAVSAGESGITGGLSDIGKYVAYGAAFLGGSLLILLGIVLIGADIGLAVFARTKTANTGQKVVGAFGERKEQKQQREYRARTSERAEAIGESKRRTQAHRETLAKARTRTERARARNLEGSRPKTNPSAKRKGEVVTGDKKTMTVIHGGQVERHSSNGTEFGY